MRQPRRIGVLSRAAAIVIVLEVETPPTIVVTAASISSVPNKTLNGDSSDATAYASTSHSSLEEDTISLRFHSFSQCNCSPRKGPSPYGEAQWECQIHGALFCVSVIQYTNSRALSGAIALLYLFIPPSPSTPMCGDFNKPAETSLTLMANGMKQSGRTRRRALRVKCLGKGIRRCPMSASCSWRLCQVTFSSGPPTTLFTYTYCTWRMGSLEFRGKKKLNVRIPKLWEPYRPRCIRRLMVAHFFKVVFNGRYIRKQNLATRTRFEVSLTRRKFL